MPRTTLSRVTPPSPYSTAGIAASWAAADTVNKNQILLTGREIIIARNPTAVALTVTINSVALNGRTGDVAADSIAAGATKVYQMFPTTGWQQSDGYLYLEASGAVEFLVIVAPVS